MAHRPDSDLPARQAPHGRAPLLPTNSCRLVGNLRLLPALADDEHTVDCTHLRAQIRAASGANLAASAATPPPLGEATLAAVRALLGDRHGNPADGGADLLVQALAEDAEARTRPLTGIEAALAAAARTCLRIVQHPGPALQVQANARPQAAAMLL